MIIVEEDKYILDCISNINDYKFKIVKKSNLGKLKKDYDILFVSINDKEDLKNLINFKAEILIFIRNIDINILYNINKYCKCLDIINVNNNIESIQERIISNLKKGEHNEKSNNI